MNFLCYCNNKLASYCPTHGVQLYPQPKQGEKLVYLTCNCTMIPGTFRYTAIVIEPGKGQRYEWSCPVHGTVSHSDYYKQDLATIYDEEVLRNIKEQGMKSAFEDQEGGRHYADFQIQPVEFITKNNLNWFDGSIIKYACRHRSKGKALDLKKVIHYARLELEQEYKIKSEVKYSDEIS